MAKIVSEYVDVDQGPCKECERDGAKGTVSNDNEDLQDTCSVHREVCNDCHEPIDYDFVTGQYFHKSVLAEPCFLVLESGRPEDTDEYDI